MTVLAFIVANKLLLFFIAASAALAISTIVLGVENSNLRESSTATTLPSTTPTPSTTTPFPPSTTPTPNMDRFRLPKTTVPISYDLYFYPDLETGLFKGKVKTRANLSEPTTEILMHNNQLKIDKVLVNNTEAKVEIDTQFENLIITNVDDKKFPKSILDIDIEFSGDLKNRIVGFYRSSYTGQDGVKRFIATSKFEPTYARQAYPCFDEPNLKATYKVHILKPKDSHYIALSNNPQSSEEDTDNGVLVHFDETVPMSTYLSCFIVCDFEFSQTEFENGGKKTPFRVYASPGQQEKTQYAGEVGASVIQYFVNYFNIPYPLPKLDLIAIPDFVSGAMEHWGLVTFRETSLLYTNQTHSSANKQRVATVVAHELSHSWFGNLVTMDWWNNLWLNEGFASYIEYKGVDHVHPDWGMLDQFLIEDLHNILDLDATQSSHPIIQTVTTPDQITEVFDTVSYSKGASVLRMLESVVGEENFRNGVTNYLKRFSYSNAVTQDLLDELQKIVGDSINITEFMNTFTTQTGYPILDVKIEGGNYVLTQKRFLSDPESSGSPSQLGYKWSVPVTYKTDKTNSPIFWFKQNDSKLTIEKPTNNSWLKFNPGQVGYYRVNYPVEEWTNLAKIIKDLSVADRTHLLEESFSIAASGDLNYTVPLELTKYLVDELHFVPWSVASLKLKTIVDYLKYSESESKIKNYIIGLLKPAYANLSWTEIADEEHLRRRARVVVLSLACAMDYEEALLKAGDLFTEWINGTGELSQDLRSIIYKYGMVNADEQTWNKLFDKFAKETDANEKLKLMYGLTSVQKPSLLVKLIDLAKDETYVRGQDYFTLLGYISVNPIGVPIVWDYVREHWTDLVGRFTLNDRYLGRLLPTITSSFSTELKFEEMQQFFEKYPEAGAGASARRQALEQVRNNIKWLSKYKTTVSGWINTQ